jgi:hypothetical protein
METNDYRNSPYSNKGSDKNMLNDISRQLTENSMVNATIRTTRMIFTELEGYRINNISLNVNFNQNHLLSFHYLIHITCNVYEDGRISVHHQITDLYTLHPTPLCYAYNESQTGGGQKPVLRFGM